MCKSRLRHHQSLVRPSVRPSVRPCLLFFLHVHVRCLTHIGVGAWMCVGRAEHPTRSGSNARWRIQRSRFSNPLPSSLGLPPRSCLHLEPGDPRAPFDLYPADSALTPRCALLTLTPSSPADLLRLSPPHPSAFGSSPLHLPQP